jgi:hypothetical protein
MHEDGFPSLRIGNRLVIPKDHFRKWVEEHLIAKGVLILANRGQ